jgi:hypothetical protein
MKPENVNIHVHVRTDSGESTANSSLAWLEEEAAHLQRGLLRDFARLAQVRLERQVC